MIEFLDVTLGLVLPPGPASLALNAADCLCDFIDTLTAGCTMNEHGANGGALAMIGNSLVSCGINVLDSMNKLGEIQKIIGKATEIAQFYISNGIQGLTPGCLMCPAACAETFGLDRPTGVGGQPLDDPSSPGPLNIPRRDEFRRQRMMP